MKQNGSLVPEVFRRGVTSKWLPFLFFANLYGTGFLFPDENWIPGYSIHTWDLIAATSGAATLAFVQIVIFSNRRTHLNHNWVRAIIPFVTLAAISTQLLWALVFVSGGIPSKAIDSMAFTFTSISGQLFVYALLIGTFSYSRFAARTLAQDRLALNQIRVRLTEEIASQKSEIQRQLTDALSPFLATFNSLGSISGASSQIQSLINQVIRPLSHSLHQSAEKSDTPSVDLNQVRKEIRKIPLRQRLSREVPISKAVSPLISFVTFINFPLIGFVYLYGYEAVAPVWIPFLAIEVLLFFAIRRIGADLAIKSYSIIMLSLFLAIVNAALLYIIGSNLFAHYPSDIVAAFALSIFLLSLGSSIFEILLEGVRQNLASAEQTNEDLAKGSALLRQELQALNKRASREIHGGVQARLQGLAIRISQQTEFTQFDFDAIANEILSSYETLTLEPQPREIRSELHELAEFWRGITSIEIAICDDVASRLNDDPVAAECLAEIARESINNSIKHAGATSMRIEISITSESDYEICISNNVNKERNLGDPSGLGTKIFDELADNWNFQGSLNSGLLLARVSSHLAIK